MNEIGAMMMGGLAGAAMTCLRQVQALGHRLLSLVVCTIHVEDDLAEAVAIWMWSELRRSPFGDRRYDSRNAFIKPRERIMTVGIELLGKDSTLFWNGWRPVLACAKSTGQHGEEVDCHNLTLTFIRGTFDADALLVRCLDLYNEHVMSEMRKRFYVHRVVGRQNREINRREVADEDEDCRRRSLNVSGGLFIRTHRMLQWSPDDVGYPQPHDPMEALALSPEVLELVEEARRWKQSEKWFKERQIAWRRGWLLYGKPGTGKTSLVRAVAQEIDIPIYAYDLASLCNDELICAWKRMLSSVPCIALMEDIDAVFHQRTNILGAQGGGLSFDCLLNCISGIEQADGVFTVVTTNDASQIDAALGCPKDGMSTRPGRLDRVIELKELEEGCRYRIAERILRDSPQAIKEAVLAGFGDTGAQFQERCSQIALRDYWQRG